MSDLIKHLEELLSCDSGKRDYSPVYVPEGDCVTYYASGEPSHAKRIDGLVTLYVSDADPLKIVGCHIKGVAKTLNRFGTFGVEILTKPQAIGFLFIAAGIMPEESPDAKRFFESPLAAQTVDLREVCATRRD